MLNKKPNCIFSMK